MNSISSPVSWSSRPQPVYLTIKCCFDILFGLAVSLVSFIPIIILAAVIIIKDPGLPFYAQTRIGKGGKPFHLVKLRSMAKDADARISSLDPQRQAEYLKEYKLSDDPRLIGYKGTGKKCFGSILRSSSMDELPQIFWNILITRSMSVVGPRPILKDELENNYTAEERQLMMSVKPGLTGYWQAYARNNAHYANGERQRMELWYIHNRSLWVDIRILLETVRAVIQKRGAGI